MLICTDHINDENLLALAKTENNISQCQVCGEKRLAIDLTSPYVHTMLKAIIRYHHNEYEYNGHFGGDETFTSLIYGRGIFSPDVYESEQNSEDFDCEISSIEVYDDDGVSVHAGYFDGMPNMLLNSIKDNESSFIKEISSELKTTNHYEFEETIKEKITAYGNSFDFYIEEGQEFYRARIGVKDTKVAYSGFDLHGQRFFSPFVNEEIGKVPNLYATPGRANRTGVSYLYCATDMYTAISEVRPHPSDIVSIGKFVAIKKIRAFDLSTPHLMDFYLTDDSLKQLSDYVALANVFNTATPPSLEGRYVITQLISDCIRQVGYEGIVFSSTVGDGKNLVIFDPSKLHYIPNSQEACEIKSVKYDFSVKGIIGRDDTYEVYRED